MRKLLLSSVALVCALSLMLSGCNLITVDPLMQLQEDRALVDKEFETVLAEYDGGTVTLGDIANDFYYEWGSYYQMYQYYGIELTADQVEAIKESSIGYALERVALAREAEARGIALTDEEKAEIEQAAREEYEASLDSYESQMGGDTPELRKEQAAFALYQQGYDEAAATVNLTAQKIGEKLREALNAEVGEVTGDELTAAYEERLEDDEATYAEDPGAFESAMTGDTLVTWMPGGYRTVKHILLIPGDDVQTPYAQKAAQISSFETDLEALESDLAAAEDDDASEGDPEAIRAEIADVEASISAAQAELVTLEAACMADVQEKLDAISQKLQEGADFQALIDEYGEDPGMQNAPTSSRGYYVSADSTTWDAAFKNAAMLLENVGDVSQPVLGGSGVHIIRYNSDVAPGALPLEDVRAALSEELLEAKRDDYYAEKSAEWIENIHPVYHYDNWSPVQ